MEPRYFVTSLVSPTPLGLLRGLGPTPINPSRRTSSLGKWTENVFSRNRPSNSSSHYRRNLQVSQHPTDFSPSREGGSRDPFQNTSPDTPNTP